MYGHRIYDIKVLMVCIFSPQTDFLWTIYEVSTWLSWKIFCNE